MVLGSSILVLTVAVFTPATVLLWRLAGRFGPQSWPAAISMFCSTSCGAVACVALYLAVGVWFAPSLLPD